MMKGRAWRRACWKPPLNGSRNATTTNMRRREREMNILRNNSKRRRVTGYNWRNALASFAATSGVLAGFCITFIALILGGSVSDSAIFPGYAELEVTYCQIAVLSLGLSAAMFITAAQFLLVAKEFDKYDIPEEFRKALEEKHDEIYEAWKKSELESDNKCLWYRSSGRCLFNIAIYTMWIGVSAAIVPYDRWVALIVFSVGIGLNLWQTHFR